MVGSALQGLAQGPNGYAVPSYVDAQGQAQALTNMLGDSNFAQLDAWIYQLGADIQGQLDYMQVPSPPPLPFAGVAAVTYGRLDAIRNGLHLGVGPPNTMQYVLTPYNPTAYEEFAVRIARNAFAAIRIAIEVSIIEPGLDMSDFGESFLHSGDELSFLADCGMLAELRAAPVFADSYSVAIATVRRWLTGVAEAGAPEWTANSDTYEPRRRLTAFLGSCLRIILGLRRGRNGGNVLSIILIGVGAFDIANQLAAAFPYTDTPVPNGRESIVQYGFRNLWVSSDLACFCGSGRQYAYLVMRMVCMLINNRPEVIAAHGEEIGLRHLQNERAAREAQEAAAARDAARGGGGGGGGGGGFSVPFNRPLASPS